MNRRHRNDKTRSVLGAFALIAIVGATVFGANAASGTPAPAMRFSLAQHFGAGPGPWLLSTGDVLGNGRTDLAVANIFSLGHSGGSLLMNNTASGAPSASFAPPTQFDGFGAQAPLLADFTGDGRADFVLCDLPGLPEGRCRVYPNTTPHGAIAPTFGAPISLATGDTPEVLAAADMNGDGKPDLVVANFASLGPNAISVFVNTSTGPGQLSFALAQNFTGGIGAEGLAVADLNGDGRPDVITGNTAGNNVTALVNLTTPGSTHVRLAAPQKLPAAAGPTAVVAADINGDGRPDLAVGSSFTYDAADLNIYLNETTPGSTVLRFTHQVFAADPGIEGITAGDFDRSGRPSIAYAAYRTQAGYQACVGGGLLPTLCGLLGGSGAQGDVGVMQNTTPPGAMTASFAAPLRLVSGPGTVAVVAGDFNNDGHPDLAAGNFLAPGASGISIFTNLTP